MKSSLKYYLLILKSFIRNNLIINMEYRSNFVIRGIFSTIWTLVQIIFISLIFYNTKSLKGWSKYEMMLLFGVDQIIFAFFIAFSYSSLSRVDDLIVKGTMDYVLIKPVNEKFYLSLNKIDMFQITPVIFGLAISIYSIIKLNITINIYQYIIVITLIIIGVIILHSIYLICVSLSFRYLKTNFVRSIILSFIGCMIYPLDIYNGLFKIIIIIFIPVGIIVDFPVRILVKDLPLGKLLYLFFIALIFSFISSQIWKKSIKSYISASS
ncbi:ABC transporter permease [Tissierella sp. P1]|uniref:ABC transporter permease n=1 Tax=Tissierella sp. P1 TaxID=1280483 RepID=UPI001303D787|nr:ABC-2 family transporter protein [Tissierella sp. P1]